MTNPPLVASAPPAAEPSTPPHARELPAGERPGPRRSAWLAPAFTAVELAAEVTAYSGQW